MTSAEQKDLTAAQARLLTALLGEPTVAAAAAVAGLTERHAFRLLASEPFRSHYQEAKRQSLAQATGRLHAAAGQAVAALVEVIDGAYEKAGPRVTAARTILEFAYRSAELEDLAGRLAAVEQQLAAAAGRAALGANSGANSGDGPPGGSP